MRNKAMILYCCICILMNVRVAECKDKAIICLTPGQNILTTTEVLKKLNDTHWETIYDFINKNIYSLEHDENIKKSLEIKSKLIELLKNAHKVRENNVTLISKDGNTREVINNDFIRNYIKKGFIGYVFRLNELLIINYKDPSTIPLILKTDAYYPSDQLSIDTYYMFGRGAISEVLTAIESGKTSSVRSRGYLRLAEFLRKSFEEKLIELNPQEIQRSKEVVLKGSTSRDANDVFYANYSLPMLIENEKNIEEKNKLKRALKNSLKYKAPSVRKFAARYLGEVGDQSDIPDLEEAMNDPFMDTYLKKKKEKEIQAQGKSNISSLYPVREAAQMAIEKIKMREGN